jgi:hypothetical protein
MNGLKKNIVAMGFSIGMSFSLFGLTKPVYLMRACLDKTTGWVTLYLKPETDACNTFKYYRIYGRDDVLNPFQLLGETNTLNTNTINLLLSNKKKWEIYISSHSACNGIDSFNSNSIFIDDVPPSYVEPDSVSIDMASQKVIGGWTTPADADIMGYSLFRVDPSTGNNILIDEQKVIFYSFNLTTFNPISTGNRLAIAAFDSCKNGGLISTYHSPILLNVSVPNNYKCIKKVTINWSPYVGWNTDSNYLYVVDINTNKTINCIRLSGATSSYTYTLPYLNTSFAFFVRSKKVGSKITSTSNIVISNVPDFPIPVTKTNIDKVTVENANEIQIHSAWSAFDSACLYSRNPISGWSLLKSYKPGIGSDIFLYNLANTSTQIVDYKLIRFNSCGNKADSTTIHHNIVLQEGTPKNLLWNPYNGWLNEGKTVSYNIQKWNGSTWNTIANTPTTTYLIAGQGYGIQKFRVEGIPNPNPSTKAWSHSNEINIDLGFDTSAKDTTLIPSGFNPSGVNPIFRISNPAISVGQASLQIYNRWGQLIFKGDAILGWDGTYNNEICLTGIYIYIIEAEFRNKREIYQGTITIIN